MRADRETVELLAGSVRIILVRTGSHDMAKSVPVAGFTPAPIGRIMRDVD
jgi:hypothetical protein